jgi:serine/threonine-protein kinase HipA
MTADPSKKAGSAAALDDAAAVNKLSRNSIMGLLYALGRETAGALIFTLPDEAPGQQTQPSRLLSDAELSQRIRARPQMPFSVWDGKVRLSIAGCQDKLAVHEQDGQWFLVDDPRLASTLIVKPEPVADFMAGGASDPDRAHDCESGQIPALTQDSETQF